MPKDFVACVKAGGRVRTVKPKGAEADTYSHICYPKGGGSPVSGEVHHKKKK